MNKNILLMILAVLMSVAGVAYSGSCASCSSEEAFAGPVISEPAPKFALTNTEGEEVSLESFKGKFVVLEWVNYDCPFVVKHYSSNNMQQLQSAYMEKGVVWLTINSSAPGLQGHVTSEQWKELAAARNSTPTHLLHDHDGKIGKKYLAQTTPHMYVIDPEGVLIYMGGIDDNPSRNQEDIKTAKNYVKQALDAALAGEEVAEPQTRPYGCSVKYAQ